MQLVVAVPVALGLALLLASSVYWPPPEGLRAPLDKTYPHEGPRAAAGGGSLAPRDSTALRTAAKAFVPGPFVGSDAVPDPGDSSWNASFLNPCWRRALDGVLRCLPLVHVLGAYQCASADLFNRLSAHPLFARPLHSSPSFYFEQNHEWPAYVDTFAPAARKMAAAPTTMVTGEASNGMMTLTWTHSERMHQPFIKSMGARWQACNANRTRGPDGERLFNECMAANLPAAHAADQALVRRAGMALEVPDILRAVQGLRVRLIAVLRNPTDRLYAAFWRYPHYRGRYGDGGFRTYHDEMAAHFRTCAGAWGWDTCAMRFESLERRFERVFYHADQHAKGCYAAFLRVYMRTFGPDWRAVLLVLRTDDYFADMRTELSRAFDFVGLPPPQEHVWSQILALDVSTNGPRRKGVPPLDDGARSAVDAFYREANRDLAQLLGNDRFAFGAPR